MRKTIIMVGTASILLSTAGVVLAAEDPDQRACRLFVENGGMGKTYDRATADQMCSEPAFRAKALKAKGQK